MMTQEAKLHLPKNLLGVLEQINDTICELGDSAPTLMTQIKKGFNYPIVEPMKTILHFSNGEYYIITLDREPTLQEGDWCFWGKREKDDETYAHCFEYNISRREGRIDVGKSDNLIDEAPLILLTIMDKEAKRTSCIIIYPYPNMLHRDLTMHSRYSGEAYTKNTLSYCTIRYQQNNEGDYGFVEVV